MRRVTYLFKIRNVEIELPEPTMEAFDKTMKEPFFSIFIGGISDLLRKDFQTLLDTKTYEIISVEEE